MHSAAGSLKRVIRLPRLYLYFSGLVLLAGLALSLGEFSLVSPWLRIGFGLLVFLLPGSYLFLLVPARDSWDLVDVVGYGFAFSVALITALGLIMRALSLSIDAVEFVWHLLAGLGFAAVYCAEARPAAHQSFRVQPTVLALISGNRADTRRALCICRRRFCSKTR